MAHKTEILWCDSTFNGWIGCSKVSPGCDSCYAAVSTPARTMGIKWGAGEPRQRTSPSNWNKPLIWNKEAFFECSRCRWRGTGKEAGIVPREGVNTFAATHSHCGGSLTRERRRVFCASLADVFDNEVPDQWRHDLFALIHATPYLDWLLLTKRIGNVMKLVDQSALTACPNLWLGATIVNQAEADRDIPKLLAVPAALRFLSMEPLLGPVDLTKLVLPNDGSMNALRGDACEASGSMPGTYRYIEVQKLDWVIAGGESGPNARPSHPDWFRALRDQCAAAGVPFMFKQWGEWADSTGRVGVDHHIAVWPDDTTSVKVGKKAAGRELDGRTHTEFPTTERQP